MSVTTHMNLEQAATGVVEWVALWNANVNILEAGPTVRREAGETMTQYLAFYIKAADGKAWLADATTGIDGIWQSASTSTGTTGLGQYDGIMANDSWAWTIGATIYVTGSGVLQEAATAVVIGRALSATEIFIDPGGPLGTHTHTLSDITDVTATPAEVNLLDLGGLTVGEVLRATAATTAAWGPLLWADLDLSVSDIADLANKSHTSLTDIGVNSHPDIDTFMASGPLPSHTHAETDIVDGSLLARVGAAESITGAWTFDDDITLSMGAQDYLLANDGNGIALQSQTSGVANILSFYTKDGGDTSGEDPIIRLYTLGTLGAVTNKQLLEIRGDASSDRFWIAALAGGTGTVPLLKLYCGANFSQLTLTNDGNIGINTVSFGASSEGVIGMLNAAVAPTALLANVTHIFATDAVGSATGLSSLGLRTEEPVAVDVDETKFSHKLPAMLNGVLYNFMLTAT